MALSPQNVIICKRPDLQLHHLNLWCKDIHAQQVSSSSSIQVPAFKQALALDKSMLPFFYMLQMQSKIDCPNICVKLNAAKTYHNVSHSRLLLNLITFQVEIP